MALGARADCRIHHQDAGWPRAAQCRDQLLFDLVDVDCIRLPKDVLYPPLRVGLPGGATHQQQPIAGVQAGAPQGDTWVLIESERARQAEDSPLSGENAIAPGEDRGIPRQGDKRGVFAQGRDCRGGVDVLQR